jgi:adenosylcobinamide-GDP ribazoletransferase
MGARPLPEIYYLICLISCFDDACFCFSQIDSKKMIKKINEYFFLPLLSAIRTLTILPIPGKDTAVFSRSLFYFPIPAVLIAAGEYGVYKFGITFLSSRISLIAFFMVLTGIFLSGAIHCDGLADFCDGMFGGKTKDQILSIMKDPRVGSFGVIALISDLVLRFLLYQSLLKTSSLSVIIMSIIFSRIMQAISVSVLPYARAQGGTAAPFSGDKKSKWLAILSLMLTTSLSLMFFDEKKILLCVLIASLITTILLIFCKKKINGVTGDCLGAISEISENGILMAGLFLIRP